LVQNGNFASTSNWNVNVGASTTFTANNNEATIVAQAQFGGIYQSINTIVNHKYLVSFEYKSTQLMRTHFKNDFPATNIYTKITNVLNATTSSINYQFYSNITDGENTINIKNAMYIDLTLLFGSTIANYIYGLETASPGSGVAYVRKLFPNNYYAYDAGSLQSVKLSEHKFTGKNQFNNQATSTTINDVVFTVNSDGTVTANGTASADTSFNIYATTQESCPFVGYILNGCPEGGGGSTYYLRISDLEVTSNDDSGNGVTINVTDTGKWRLSIIIKKDYKADNLIFRPMIRPASTSATYEPYESHSYALDSSKEIRGIFKLDSANKLYCDGDIYESTGIITRNYEIIDMGTIDWMRNAEYNVMYTLNLPNKKTTGTVYSYTNFICDKYTPVAKTYQELLNGEIAGALTAKAINIKDDNYTDPAVFKSAMSGHYLVYEAEIPTEESAAAYSNPQFYDKFGTEEYVDYGVSQSTRDVAIPTGHETTYVKF